MAGTKQIQNDKWVEHCSLFTNGNRGRLVSITALDDENSREVLVQDTPFMALDYDPGKKGNDMVISLGSDQIVFSHTIENPVEYRETHDDSGRVTSVEITDNNKGKIILTFN